MYRALWEPGCLEEVTFLQLGLKGGFGLQLTSKRHSLGVFATLVGEMISHPYDVCLFISEVTFFVGF